MTDEDAFLAAIAACPADDWPRLVYADWLDDHGHADRAVYLRAAVDMAGRCGDGRPDGPAVDELLRLAEPLTEGWRSAVAGRFAAVLLGCGRSQRLQLAARIQQATGLRFIEAATRVAEFPSRLVTDVPFETADRVRRTASAVPGVLAVVAPADAPLSVPGLKYRIVAEYDDFSANEDDPARRELLAAAFRDFVGRVLHMPPDRLAEVINDRRVVVATVAAPGHVAERKAAVEALIPTLNLQGFEISVFAEADYTAD